MKTMSQMEGVELVGVCDPDEARAKRAGEKLGAAPFASYSRMLDETQSGLTGTVGGENGTIVKV